jgi:hypothetical protein
MHYDNSDNWHLFWLLYIIIDWRFCITGLFISAVTYTYGWGMNPYLLWKRGHTINVLDKNSAFFCVCVCVCMYVKDRYILEQYVNILTSTV